MFSPRNSSEINHIDTRLTNIVRRKLFFVFFFVCVASARTSFDSKRKRMEFDWIDKSTALFDHRYNTVELESLFRD